MQGIICSVCTQTICLLEQDSYLPLPKYVAEYIGKIISHIASKKEMVNSLNNSNKA